MKYFQYPSLLHLFISLSVSDDSVSPASSEHLDPEQEASVSHRAEGGPAGEQDPVSDVIFRVSQTKLSFSVECFLNTAMAIPIRVPGSVPFSPNLLL